VPRLIRALKKSKFRTRHDVMLHLHRLCCNIYYESPTWALHLVFSDHVCAWSSRILCAC